MQPPSRPLRFVHTADLHLGSRVITLPGMHPDVSSSLTDATYTAWQSIIDLCIREEVDFLLVAGDVYDSADRNIRAQLQFRDGLRQLEKNDIAAYIVHGNHDPANAWSRSIQLPKNAHCFSSDEPEVIIHSDQDGTPIAAIAGMSFATAHIRENLAERFPPRDREWPFTIGLLHCSVGGAAGHEPYAPCSIDDLRECGYEYWALGHIHQPATISAGDPYIIYAGNPQGRDMGETGDRGCRLVTVNIDGSVGIESVWTGSYRWDLIEIDISGASDLGILEEKIRERLAAVSEEAYGPIITRLILTGVTPLNHELAGGGITALAERLTEDTPVGKHPVYPERIISRTTPQINREEIIAREDILGEICKKSAGLLSGEKQRIAEAIAPLYISYARSYLNQPDDDEITAIIEEAEALLLSRLAAGGIE